MPRPKKEKPALDLNVYTKSGKLRKRKRKQSRNYFTQETEDAIIEYLAEMSRGSNLEGHERRVSDAVRNEIFNEKINYSFYKLVENIIHTFKFYYTEVDNVDQLIHEVVTFLLEKLHLYDNKKGKAYSYFGTIAKRWLIVYNEKNYQKQKIHTDLSEVDEDKSVYNNIVNEGSVEEQLEFIDKYVLYIEQNINKLFEKELDRKICKSVLELFKKRENLEVINKQASYLYLKEMSGTTAPQITKVLKELKDIRRKLMNEYYLIGDIYI
jgi:hypothetical protein